MTPMEIELKMFMRFKRYLPEGAVDGKARINVADGSTFGDLLNTLGMPVEEDKIIVINGISYKQGAQINAHTLQPGDTVAIFPPIAGG